MTSSALPAQSEKGAPARQSESPSTVVTLAHRSSYNFLSCPEVQRQEASFRPALAR